jgi:23S rRNA (cytidine1920-2'-O)/16S rRNA (cytidine1409-2'-O)-methyltransferase
MAGREKRVRLDRLLIRRGIAANSEEAEQLLDGGMIRVAGCLQPKLTTLCSPDCHISVQPQKRFVSRGGEKLAAGLKTFSLDVSHLICADIGCSTGGFTDCLLQNGAARVYAVDVGYGVLDWKLRSDERVVVLERCNARYIGPEQIPEAIDLAVIDASFISLALLLAPVMQLFGEREIRIVALVKPQFELKKEQVGAGGVVREEKLQLAALDKVRRFAEGLGLSCEDAIPSPIQGARAGNQEYLLYVTGPGD